MSRIPEGYKQTEVGVIPESWDVSPIGALASTSSGTTPPRALAERYFRNGNIPWVKTLDLNNSEIHATEELVTQAALAETCLRLYPVGTVLVAMYGGYNQIGRTGLLTFPATVNQALTAIRPHPMKLNSHYLLRVLHHRIEYWKAVASSSRKDPNINSKDIREFPLAIPPLPEQAAIAEALSDADALISGIEKLIAKKRNVKQGAMQVLLKPKEEWVVKKLGEVFSISGGYSASREQLSNDGFCYLHYGDIHGAKKTFINVKNEYTEIPKLKISLKSVSPKSLLNEGDIVFVDASEDDEGTSRHIVVKNPDGVPYIAGLHTIVAKSKDDSINNDYKRHCFQSSYIKSQFKFYAVGTKVSGISKTNIAKIEISLPPLSEQTRIAAILSDMDAEIEGLGKRLDKYRRIKQGMMQELLTGKIRLIANSQVKLQVFPIEKQIPKKNHNWQINEAVVIAVLAKYFGSEQFPLARKRCTKLTYLLHRHVEHETEGYLKKAAGPYNPNTRYKGPEAIAHKKGYVRSHHNGKYEGFVAADNVGEAETYFEKWYGAEVLNWLEQFRFEKTEELELLATVDMAMEDLSREGKTVKLNTVKQVIHDHPEWEAKLQRDIFSDINLISAIRTCRELFA